MSVNKITTIFLQVYKLYVFLVTTKHTNLLNITWYICLNQQTLVQKNTSLKINSQINNKLVNVNEL